MVNVLVVDDDEDTRDLIATILTQAGYTVETAASGRDALEWIQTQRPELIFLDIQMPDMDGAEFREQQRRNPDWITIPTIVVTGSKHEPHLDLAIRGTLHKPAPKGAFLEYAQRFCTPPVRGT